MIPLTAIQSSNSRIATTYPSGLVAVFVGATAGIGEYSLVEFARSAPKSRIYFVGRSDASGARIKAECDKLNPEGSCTFIKADVSLMKNVDEVCKELKSKEKTINLLFQSQGVLDFKNGMFFHRKARINTERNCRHCRWYSSGHCLALILAHAFCGQLTARTVCSCHNFRFRTCCLGRNRNQGRADRSE